MVNLSTGRDFDEADEEESGNADITEHAFFAPAFYEAWDDWITGTYTTPDGVTHTLREMILAGGRGCVDGDTLVDTPMGKVRIRDFKGGKVLCFDGGRMTVGEAKRPTMGTEEDLYAVTVEDGRTIVCTDQHKFLTGGGKWKQMCQLALGEPLVMLGKCGYAESVSVASIRFVKRDYYYDLDVVGTHNYFANGFLNHNSTKSSFAAAAIVLALERDWQDAEDRKCGRNGMGIGPNHDLPDKKWYRHLTNAIVYRKVAATLADSVYNQFAQTMGDYMGEAIMNHWKFRKSPLSIVNEESGQVIMFRGLDDPLKSKSIKPPKGYFRYLWLEEWAEFDGMEEVRSVRQSILRGGKKMQSIYSYNPPETSSNWVNEEAERVVEGRKLYKSDYLSVPKEWLGEDFFIEAENLKKQNYRAYRHEYLGEVTGNGGTIFPNLVEREISDEEIKHYDIIRYGLDFGFAIDPAAVAFLYYDVTRRRVVCFNEIYERGLTNQELAEKVLKKIVNLEFVHCDSAEPKSIAELISCGINALAVRKGPDSIRAGIHFLQSMNSIECDMRRTPNFYNEFKKYEYEKDKSGNFVSRYPDGNGVANHLIDACRYGLEDDMTHGGLF